MTPCLDDNTLTALLEGRLREDERRALEAHADECPRCGRLLIELGRMSSPPASEPEPMAERYRLLEPIGSGAMGVVFSALDTKLSRKVAIKRLHDDGGDGSGRRRERRLRFLREAQLLAALSHPNVLTVFDIGTIDGELAVVMELVDGWPLSRWLEEARPARRQVIEAFLAAGEGLAAAHRVGIVHRDVKPDNILVARTGRVLVTDFGLAGLVEASPDRPRVVPPPALDAGLGSITQTGEVLGTPAYMAPEQRLGRLGDERSDQYAFCASLFEALHGHSVGAEPPGKADRDLARVDRVLEIGLRLDAGARFASMEELLATLRRAAAPGRTSLLVAGAAVVCLVTIASVWWARTPDGKVQPPVLARPAIAGAPGAPAPAPTRATPPAAENASTAKPTVQAPVAEKRRKSATPATTRQATLDRAPVGHAGAATAASADAEAAARAALAAAKAARGRRDGAACLAALEKASLPGLAELRGECEMLRGHCNEGKHLLVAAFTEDNSPPAHRRQVENRVRDYALRLCPLASFSSPLDRFEAIFRQAREARKANDATTCRTLDRELMRALPTAYLESAHRRCQAFEAAVAPRAREALLAHQDLPQEPRPIACEEPRHSISLALGEIGVCLAATGACADGAERLLLSELVAHRDQPGSTDVTVAAAVASRSPARDYPDCGSAMRDLASTAQRAQRSIDELAPMMQRGDRVGRAGELEQTLRGFGLRLLCESGQRECRLVPVFGKGG